MMPIKRPFALAVTVLGLVAGAAGQADAEFVTLTFDSFPTLTLLPGDRFADQGVVFDQALLTSNVPFIGQAQSPPNYAIGLLPPFGSLSGSFTGAVSSVTSISVFAGDFLFFESDTITLKGFDAANRLVDTDSFTATTARTLAISGAGIARFEINSSTGFGIDNFTFEPTVTPVPEPASFAMLGTSVIVGLGIAWRRRRAA
jgi:hypothetical protein